MRLFHDLPPIDVLIHHLRILLRRLGPLKFYLSVVGYQELEIRTIFHYFFCKGGLWVIRRRSDLSSLSSNQRGEISLRSLSQASHISASQA